MNTVIKAYTLSECMEMMAEYASAFEKTGVDVHGFFDSFLSGKAIL